MTATHRSIVLFCIRKRKHYLPFSKQREHTHTCHNPHKTLLHYPLTHPQLQDDWSLSLITRDVENNNKSKLNVYACVMWAGGKP